MERTYPHGVSCWIDTVQPDVDAAVEFYSALFGWHFTDAAPPDAPTRYLIATLDGSDVAGLGSSSDRPVPTWQTYIAVDDCDAAAARAGELGARITSEPADAGPGGRSAGFTDPEGAALSLWQARRRLGAQVTNVPGAWNFSDLHTGDPEAAVAFYRELFGWQVGDQAGSRFISVPGYGDHLAATVDPDIHERQKHAPPGFADVIGAIADVTEGEDPHWHVTFTVGERDASVATVERLGGTVHASGENDWTRWALVSDPAGARFTVSQFAPKNF